MKRLTALCMAALLLVCGAARAQKAGRTATERYVDERIGDASDRIDLVEDMAASTLRDLQSADNRLTAALAAEAAARAAGDAVALTNWQAVVYSLTNGAARGETALQPADTNGWEVGSHAGLATKADVAAGDAANSNHVAEALGHFAATGTVYKAGHADMAERAAWADRATQAGQATVAVTADWANSAGQAQWAGEAGRAQGLVLESPDGEALDSLKSHPADPAAHPDIRALVDSISIPTNTANGWLVWDSGSNCFWRVTATNLRFYVWEAQ